MTKQYSSLSTISLAIKSFLGLDDYTKAESYHRGNSETPKDLALATKYYRAAAESGDTRAYQRLSDVAREEGRNSEAFFYQGLAHEVSGEKDLAEENYQKAITENHLEAPYRLARLYIASSREINPTKKAEGLKLLRQIATTNHKRAFAFLLDQSNQDGDIAFLLAEMYALGELKVADRVLSALPCYVRAAKLGNKAALEKLEEYAAHCDKKICRQIANIYETRQQFANALSWYLTLSDQPQVKQKIDELGKKDRQYLHQIAEYYAKNQKISLALPYYLAACRKQYSASLTVIEKYVEYLNTEDQLDLAMLYINAQQFTRAILVYKRLADKKLSIGDSGIMSLAERHSECAYIVAQEYQKEGNLDKAYFFFIMAYRKTYFPAVQWFEEVSAKQQAGDVSARYYLDRYYVNSQCDELLAVANLQRVGFVSHGPC